MAGTSKPVDDVDVVELSSEESSDESSDDVSDEVSDPLVSPEPPLCPLSPTGTAVEPEDPPLPPPQAVTKLIVDISSKSRSCLIISLILLIFLKKKGKEQDALSPLSN
jgi:hypothetical protein